MVRYNKLTDEAEGLG